MLCMSRIKIEKNILHLLPSCLRVNLGGDDDSSSLSESVPGIAAVIGSVVSGTASAVFPSVHSGA